MENEGLQTILALLQRVIVNEGSAHWESAWMHISKLKCFDGTQDAKEIENCFKVARVEEEAKRLQSCTSWMTSFLGGGADMVTLRRDSVRLTLGTTSEELKLLFLARNRVFSVQGVEEVKSIMEFTSHDTHFGYHEDG